MSLMGFEDRCRIMVNQYGEVCTKTVAAKVMGCDPRTITRWIEEGRIDDACEGTRVDVRSLARYLTSKKQIDLEVRRQRLMLRNNTQFVV